LFCILFFIDFHFRWSCFLFIRIVFRFVIIINIWFYFLSFRVFGSLLFSLRNFVFFWSVFFVLRCHVLPPFISYNLPFNSERWVILEIIVIFFIFFQNIVSILSCKTYLFTFSLLSFSFFRTFCICLKYNFSNLV
jgi:hypothetical protein